MRLEERLASRNMALIPNTAFFRTAGVPHETRGQVASRNMTLIHNTVFFRSIRGPHETRGEAGLQEYDSDS